MRVLSISHGPHADAGVFAQAAEAAGHEHHEASYASGSPPPESPAGYDAVMVFGGAMNTHEEATHPWLRREKAGIREALEAGVPLLGICLGSQLVAEVAGGTVSPSPEPEIGWYEVELTEEAADDPVFGALPGRFTACQWHSYQSSPPAGAVELARSPACLQAYRANGSAWGAQFHAEVTAENLEVWISNYRNDPQAVRLGFDPDQARAELAEQIEAWNELGRRLCTAFLEYAAERVAPAAGHARA